MTMIVSALHELTTGDLLKFEDIEIFKKSTLNHPKLPEMEQSSKYYRELYNIVDIENKRIGINKLCKNKEAYNIHIQNECCSILISDFANIDSDEQRK
jgi:hypothetical protein